MRPPLLSPSPLKEYLNQVFDYLKENNRQMDVDCIARKFGPISNLIPRELGKNNKKRKLKWNLENDSRFVLHTITKGRQKGVCIVRARAPRTVKEYLNAVYDYLLQNDVAIDLSEVGTKFGPVSRFAPNTNLKALLERDSQSRFIIESLSNDNDKWAVRASQRQPRRQRQPQPQRQPQSQPQSERTTSEEDTFCVNENATKEFKLADKKIKCHYISTNAGLQKAVNQIRQSTIDSPLRKIISVSWCWWEDKSTRKKSLEIFKIATSLPEQVFLVDCQKLGKENAVAMLEPLLADQTLLKLAHDLRGDCMDAILNFFDADVTKALEKPHIMDALEKPYFLDTQLVGELLWKNPAMGQNEFLSKLDLPRHSGPKLFLERHKANFDLWSKRPIAWSSLECAALEVASLQNAASFIGQFAEEHLQRLLVASTERIDNAWDSASIRSLCFDAQNNFASASVELMKAYRPDDIFYGEPLEIECNIEEVLSLLPPVYTEEIGSFLELQELEEFSLDLGRRPFCWIGKSREFLCDDPNKVFEHKEMEEMVSRLGNFGGDNRTGLDGSLHRFSAMRDRRNNIIGITIRIGRCIKGNASMMMDLLMANKDKSILILGEPGSGKTTIIREATRILAAQDNNNVIVVDTSNEIAGDGKVPHSCIGMARRMMVPSLDEQASVMIECIQNHTPHVMVIDEIGRSKEVKAASTCKQRGVRILASAHGDLRKLVKNNELNGLVGGLETVTIGDTMAVKQAKENQIPQQQIGSKSNVQQKIQKRVTQRRSAPIFDIIVEISRNEKDNWRIVHDTAFAVDRILEGLSYPNEFRSRDRDTRMWVWLDEDIPF